MTLNNITFEDYSDSSDLVLNPSLNISEVKKRKRKRIITRKRRNKPHTFELDVPCSDDESVHLPNPEITPIKHKEKKELSENNEKTELKHNEEMEKKTENDEMSTDTHIYNENIIEGSITNDSNNEKNEKNDDDDDDKWLEEEDLETDLSKEEIKSLRSTIDRVSEKPISHYLIPYVFKRETKITWKGKRINFQFNRGETPLFHAKIKGNGSQQQNIFIAKGTESHINQTDYVAILVPDSTLSFFCLMIDNKESNEKKQIMSILFKQGFIVGTPRSCIIEFDTPIKSVENRLFNKPPIVYPNGTWILDLNGRFAKKSIKNCIIIDSKQNEIFSLMKRNSSTADVEAHANIDPLCVFAFALSCYICEL